MKATRMTVGITTDELETLEQQLKVMESKHEATRAELLGWKEEALKARTKISRSSYDMIVEKLDAKRRECEELQKKVDNNDKQLIDPDWKYEGKTLLEWKQENYDLRTSLNRAMAAIEEMKEIHDKYWG